MPFITVTDAELNRPVRVNVAAIACYYVPDLKTQRESNGQTMIELVNEDMLPVKQTPDALDILILTAEAMVAATAARAIALGTGPSWTPPVTGAPSPYDGLRFSRDIRLVAAPLDQDVTSLDGGGSRPMGDFAPPEPPPGLFAPDRPEPRSDSDD